MALDEAHLVGLGPGGERDRVLRFTTWAPTGTSLGYFQKLDEIVRLPPGPVVRRMTGGGAIHHAGELTFTLAAPDDDPLYAGPVADSYERVHALLAEALLEFGVRAEPRGSRTLASERDGTGMCFAKSSRFDLVWPNADGELAKGVGSAQRRKRGRVLHHGSIKLDLDSFERGVALAGIDALELQGAWTGVLQRHGFDLVASRASEQERDHTERRAASFLVASTPPAGS